jgi:anti-sigma factor RsiW
MMHLSDEELLALDDGELPRRRTDRALQHLAECLACAQRLKGWRESEVQLAKLLHAVDHPAPAVSADQLIARATVLSTPHWRPALAAGFALLILAGAAAAAVPGSFVRRYAERMLARAPFSMARPASGRHAPSGAQQTAASGIAFVPSRDVEILFRDAQSAGEMRITLRDSDVVRVAHSGGSAAYTLTDAGVMVENVGSGASYAIVLPRGETRAVIRVGNRAVFTKRNAHVSTTAAQDSSGAYVLDFTHLSRRKDP